MSDHTYIERGRREAVNIIPQLEPLLMRMPLRISEAVPTAAVNKYGVITVNPSFARNLDRLGLAQLFLHEALHVFSGHTRPVPVHEAYAWNLATDADVHRFLEPTHLPSPVTVDGLCDQGLIPETGLSAEEMFQHLRKRFHSQVAAGGSVQPLDDVTKSEGAVGGDGIDEVEMDKLLMECAKKLVRCGNAPRDLIRRAAMILRPRRLAFRMLRRFAQQAIGGIEVPSFAVPRIPSIPQVIKPGYRLVGSRVVAIVDTSGSMWADLDEALGVLHDVAAASGNECHVILCDTIVQDEFVYRRGMPITWKGGGGSIMTPAFERAEKYKPGVIVIITDCVVEWPTKAPSARVLVVKTIKRIKRAGHVPPWAWRVVEGWR